jgi:UDP-3-O-[3-hydroxymyristoyl] glucosamine N-acyltransferase
MKFPVPTTLEQIAQLLQCAYVGAPHLSILGLNEIHRVEPGDLVFVDHPKYYDKALQSAATFILIDKEVPCPEGKGLLISEDPCRDFNRLARHFCPWQQVEGLRGEHTVHPSSQVHASVIMGHEVHIGKNCIVHPGVVLYDRVSIGDDCIIHANTVIGSDAFYYKNRPGGREKMHSSGSVIIEDGVEIGASCTIDKGMSADTRIGQGTKIDNHVHIGHDTIVGPQCLMAAQVALAGCVVLGKNVVLWGQVGVASGIHIGDDAVVLAQSGVSKNLEGGKTYFGSPADDARTKFKEMALLRNLDDRLQRPL